MIDRKQVLGTIALAIVVAGGANAHRPSAAECREASDFIANAAIGRDNGMTRAAFLGRLEEDFVAIRAFPPALRWFVMDEGDEQLLRQGVARVFDAPLPAALHRRDFERRCAVHGIDPADG